MRLDYGGADLFSTVDVCKIFDIKRGRLKNWTEQGFITAKVQIPDKRGKVSYFTRDQLYTIHMFRSLVNVGISRSYASTWSKAFDNLRKSKIDHDANFVVFDLAEYSGQSFKVGDITIKPKQNVKSVTISDNVVFTPDQDFDQVLIINLVRLKTKVDFYVDSY